MEAAGLVIGLIPLGYKIYTEVDEYIESTRNADSETASLLALLRRGRNLLQLFALIVNRNGPIQDRMEDLVAETCADLQKDFDSASKIVKKLRGEKDVEKAERAATFPQGLQGLSKKKKFTYHFRRESLRKLEEHLTHANTHLSLVLQMYSLVVSSVAHAETNSLLGDIKTDIQSLTTVQAKPRLLFEDDVTSQQDTSFATPKTEVDDETLLCQCRARSLVKRSTTGSPWLSLSRERKTIIVHDPSCVYHKLEGTRSERSFTITVGGQKFWNQISTAIAISINLPSGRFGQWSICPQMRTYNIINFEESPAIRLFDFADELEDLEWDDPCMEKKARTYWHERIIEVFRTGKSSPFDVDGLSNKPILHYLRFTSRKSGRPYEQLIWETLQKLDFPEHMQLCDGLEPWAYNFSRSHPLVSGKLNADLLPWNLDRWLEPTEIPEELLEGNSPAYGKLGRAFVLAIIMDHRRSLLESSNIGPLCQAIIMRCGSKALGILDDNISSWNESFMGDESSVCAIDLAIMWFPELMNALLEENKGSDSRLNRLRLPRPHPSQHSFLEPALAFGLTHGGKFGKATTQEYLAMVSLALERDYPIYFKPISPYLGLATAVVTEHLADRRRRLLDLARRRLDQSTVDLSKGPDKVLADEQLEEILQAFKDQGITLPEALLPRNLEDGKCLSGSIFEYATHSEDLSDRLEELGFDPEGFVRSRCRDGPFLINPEDMACCSWDCWQYLWMDDIISKSKTAIGQISISCEHEHPRVLRSEGDVGDSKDLAGCPPKSCAHRELSAPTLLLALMGFLGGCMPSRDYSYDARLEGISPFVKPHLLVEETDNCFCGCSDDGCSSLLVFIHGMLFNPMRNLSVYMERVIHCLRILRIVFDTNALPQWTVMQVLRLSTFDCLDCRHTCCKASMHVYLYRRSKQWPCQKIDSEERGEIREEDSEKLEILEASMKEMELALGEKDWDVLHFVRQRWLPMMEKVIQSQSERQLSLAEIEGMRDVGVSWALEPEASEVSDTDDDNVSVVSIRFDRMETDEERLRGVTEFVDRIIG